MGLFRVTIRYGYRQQRYHTIDVEAEDVRSALVEAAESLPEEVAEAADLVELREVPDPDARSYMGEDGTEGEE